MKNWLCILLVLMVGAFSASAITRNAGDGNVLGAITNGSVVWTPSRLNLYAPVEGYSPPRPSLNTPTYLSLGYRTRPVTAAGFVQLGMRPYDLQRRAFISGDPFGHVFDPALNTAFYGIPSRFYDPEGLYGKQVYQNGVEQANGVIGWVDDVAINSVVGTFALGNQAFGLAARALYLDPSNFDSQAKMWQSYMSPYARAGYYNDNKPGVQLATAATILVNPETLAGKLGSLGRTGITAAEIETSRYAAYWENLGKTGMLSDRTAREWYLWKESQIPTMLDSTASLEQQAMQASSLRNELRSKARALMADRDHAAFLERTDPNMTWNQVVERYKSRGFSGDALWREIISASQRSRTSVNKALGLQ